MSHFTTSNIPPVHVRAEVGLNRHRPAVQFYSHRRRRSLYPLAARSCVDRSPDLRTTLLGDGKKKKFNKQRKRDSSPY